MNPITKILSRLTSAGKQILYGPRRPFYFRGSTVVNEDTSMQVAAYHRGVIYLSTQVAKLPWTVKSSRNELVEDNVSRLLDLRANPEMNAFKWRLTMMISAINWGNAYSEIERDSYGRAVALWPLLSSQMEIMRSQSGELFYRYNNPDGSTTYLHPSNVFHVPNFYTKDGIVGQGVVAYAKEVLGIQIAADAMASGIFHNSGIPSGILIHKGRLSDEAYKRLKESWDNQQGGRKTGSTALLEEGMTYQSVDVDPEALQFLESRKFGVLEMARFLNVPPTKLFDTSAATYSNVEQSNLEVTTDILDAWATNFEMEADVKLLNNRFGGKFTHIDLYSVSRGDMKTRSDYFKAMMSLGAMTPNEIREREGMAPYVEGDKYYIATNNYTPADKIDEMLDADIEAKKAKTQQTLNPPERTVDEPEDELSQAAIEFLRDR